MEPVQSRVNTLSNGHEVEDSDVGVGVISDLISGVISGVFVGDFVGDVDVFSFVSCFLLSSLLSSFSLVVIDVVLNIVGVDIFSAKIRPSSVCTDVHPPLMSWYRT